VIRLRLNSRRMTFLAVESHIDQNKIGNQVRFREQEEK